MRHDTTTARGLVCISHVTSHVETSEHVRLKVLAHVQVIGHTLMRVTFEDALVRNEPADLGRVAWRHQPRAEV